MALGGLLDVGSAISALKSLALTLSAVLLFAAFGPPILPLSGLPHVQMRDVGEDLMPAPSKPLEGKLAPNTILRSATVLFNNTLHASESVLVLPDGSLLLADKYGYAYTAAPLASAPGGYALSKPIIHLGPGRPMGMKLLPDGSGIIICMAGSGLVKLELPDAATGASAKVVLLGSRVSADSPKEPNSPILFPNGLDITADGSVVFFTDSQAIPVLPNWGATKRPWYDIFQSFLLGVCSGQASGRLLAYYPATGAIHVLAKGFWYANGVALAPDESYVVMTETVKFRILRFWLTGPMNGKLDVLIDGLPGFPDNVTPAPDNQGFWVAMPSPRSSMFDITLKVRLVRVILAYLPPWARPPFPTWGAVALVSPEGTVSQFLMDPDGSHVSSLSHAQEQILPDGRSRLWLGTVDPLYIAYIDI